MVRPSGVKVKTPKMAWYLHGRYVVQYPSGHPADPTFKSKTLDTILGLADRVGQTVGATITERVEEIIQSYKYLDKLPTGHDPTHNETHLTQQDEGRLSDGDGQGRTVDKKGKKKVQDISEMEGGSNVQSVKPKFGESGDAEG